MKSNGLKFRQHLRLIWAITWKDILDGWKNKTILANLVVVTLMIVFYKTLPSWENNPEVPSLLVYDAGNSSLVVALEDSTTVNLYQYDSQQEMDRILARGSIPELGLVIPADFDQALEAGKALELDGYVVHWVSDEAAEELKQMAEAEIAALAGREVRINLEGNQVYTQAESTGLAFLASVSVIFSVAMLGLLVTPHLMIEEKTRKNDRCAAGLSGQQQPCNYCKSAGRVILLSIRCWNSVGSKRRDCHPMVAGHPGNYRRGIVHGCHWVVARQPHRGQAAIGYLGVRVELHLNDPGLSVHHERPHPSRCAASFCFDSHCCAFQGFKSILLKPIFAGFCGP